MGQPNSRPRPSISPQYLRPQLYKRPIYDERALRKAILDRKLAPCYPGSDESSADTEECPICMLNYPGGLNRSICCAQPICTECYLQVVPRLLPKGTACPFCKKMDYVAEYQGPLSEEARQLAMTEEQRVIELQIESNLRQEKAYMEKLAAQGIAVAASPGGNAQRTSNLPGSPTTGPSPYDGGHPQMNTSEGPSCISIFSSEECSSPGSTPMHRPNASPGSGCGTSSTT